MTKRPELSFDGCGINGPDIYRTRIATFNRDLLRADPEAVTRYGKLFEQAPVLKQALENLLADMSDTGVLDAYNEKWGCGVGGAVSDAQAVLKLLES